MALFAKFVSLLECRWHKICVPTVMADTSTLLDPYKPIITERGGKVVFDSREPYVAEFAQKAISLSADPAGLFQQRIRGRQLFLENQPQNGNAKAGKQKATPERSRRLIYRRSRAHTPLWQLSVEQTKFELFIPLHRLWMDYMAELLNLVKRSSTAEPLPPAPNTAGMQAKLVKADFHGCILQVRRSKNDCIENLSGIVLHETENTFRIITRQDELKCVPKKNSVFVLAVPLMSCKPSSLEETVFDVPHLEFELYGNQLGFRAADRATKKFKAKATIEL